MAEPQHGAAGGLFESLKGLSSSLAGFVQTRLELLSTDIAEERAHLTTLLLLGLVSLFCLGVGIVLVAILIAVFFWDTHRLAALGGMAGFFLFACAALAWLAAHKARIKPRLFAASIAELAKDRERLHS